MVYYLFNHNHVNLSFSNGKFVLEYLLPNYASALLKKAVALVGKRAVIKGVKVFVIDVTYTIAMFDNSLVLYLTVVKEGIGSNHINAIIVDNAFL